MRLVHEKRKPYKCSDCSEAFKLRHHLTKHEKVFHTSYECKTCEKSFGEKRDLKRHYDSHMHIKRAQILVDSSMAHEGEKPFKI